MFKSGPNYNKLKTNLRLCINRLKLLEKKKAELAMKARKEIADYISAAKEDRARIRVECIVREDYLVEAMEILEMYCDLLLARFGLVQTLKELDPGLEEPIASIIWATPRLQADCAELKAVSEQLTHKYGKEFAEASRTNSLNLVNDKLIHKLSVHAPPKLLIEKYMIEIARTYNVPFEPDPTVMRDDEIYAAESTLINFDNNKPGGGPSDGGFSGPSSGGGSGGGGGGFPVMPEVKPMDAAYPPGGPVAGAYPPPLPAVPAAGNLYPPQQGGHAPPFTYPDPHEVKPPLPSYNSLYDGQKPASAPPGNQPGGPHIGGMPDLPDLPAVPDSLPPAGGASVNEDVDFDDLTKRFEELKKRK
ncbi:IST1 homolog [Lingula anatina]|uniref:IST1 homolog n=1 Tax=Lingula anatina TaxID=7574 RepID=A0A1S3H4V5_LINAN|nr:IST1 homolog [Lingula anatina]|eukprot:XP_013381038.1 IST1 homolog [Lingula anatina]